MRANFLHHLFQPKVDSDAVSVDGYECTNLISADYRERSKGVLAAHFIKPPIQMLFQLPFPVNVEKILLNPRVGSQLSSGFEILVAGVRQKVKLKDTTSVVNTSNPTVEGHGAACPMGKELPRRRKRKSDIFPVAVGEKRQKGKLVQAKSNQINNTTAKVTDNKVPLHSHDTDITCASAKSEHRNLFSSVAHVFVDDGKPFVICNNRFCERPPVQGPQVTTDVNICNSYNFRNPHSMWSVTHVLVRIIKVLGSSVPALRNIEVWGQPSPSNPQVVTDLAFKIQEQISEEGQVGFHNNKLQTHRDKNNDTLDTVKQKPQECNKLVDIPEEFIDSITCGIMTIPVLLPSGHNVDSTTLEKHTESERAWGRQPSDPFTGIPFSDSYRALPNSSLKVRIDRFLLMSSVDVSKLGRTVGRFQSAGSLDTNVTIKKSGYSVAQLTQGGDAKQQCYGSHDHCKSRQLVVSVPEDKPETDTAASSPRYSGADHESALSQSLDMALTETLGGLESFTRFTQPSPQCSKDSTVCTSSLVKDPVQLGTNPHCNNTSENSNTTLAALQCSLTRKLPACPGCQKNINGQSMFRLPCGHTLCRHCLVSLGHKDNPLCSTCGEQFERINVVRVHTL